MLIDVKVLDENICVKCPLFAIEEYQMSYYNGDVCVTANRRYRCKNLDMCLLLKRQMERNNND